jgi:hypothetical protein
MRSSDRMSIHFGRKPRKLNVPILVALIAAAAAIVAPSLTYVLTKYQEREAQWRKLKLEKYGELLQATSELGGDETAGQRFANAANDIDLVATPDVLVALRAFLEPIVSPPKEGLTNERHDELFTTLMYAIRADVGEPNRAPEGFRLKLWSASKAKPRDVGQKAAG